MYQYALEVAGATVHEFEQFGSWQGDWWAKVTYQGNIGWVNGGFGSCCVCDAFESEFGCESHECINKESYDPVYEKEFYDDCPKCQEIKQRLIEFGADYLECILTQEEAEKKASENIDWDLEADEMLNFIKDHKGDKIK